MAGRAHSLRDEDTSCHRSGELVTRFLSHAEPYGFRLSLVVNGSAAEPRFAGNWSWHQRGVRLSIPEARERDAARVIACAALLRDEILKHRIDRARSLSDAA